MIQKELIWNLSLLLFGVVLLFLFTFQSDVTIVPGWQSYNMFYTPFGYVDKWVAGLLLGICLILFRYVNLAILAIKNSDLKTLVLLLSYSFPIFLVLVLYHFSINNFEKQIAENFIPFQHIDKKVNNLRECGLFKKYKEKSDTFISDFIVGKFIRNQNGHFNSGQLLSENYKDIRVQELMRLDADKVWQNNDTEWVVEGNKSYEKFIKELGELSEDNFIPQNIKEQWLNKEKIELTFEAEGRQHKVFPLVERDWADTNAILKYINELMKSKNYQFYYLKDDNTLIICLSDEERKKLSDSFHFEFENPLE